MSGVSSRYFTRKATLSKTAFLCASSDKSTPVCIAVFNAPSSLFNSFTRFEKLYLPMERYTSLASTSLRFLVFSEILPLTAASYFALNSDIFVLYCFIYAVSFLRRDSAAFSIAIRSFRSFLISFSIPLIELESSLIFAFSVLGSSVCFRLNASVFLTPSSAIALSLASPSSLLISAFSRYSAFSASISL